VRSTCPYNSQPPSAWWRQSIERVVPAAVNPATPEALRIDRDTVVASAGSCFAQHIRNHLVRRSYNYLITEPGPQDRTPAELSRLGYGVFPARFSNIYTTVQLLQLFERAYGSFVPEEDHWIERDRYFDPFRPHIEPNGFESLEALRADREIHLAATRRMFEAVEIFVFTLGLTEGWRSRLDGAVYPVCPGCSVGTFDADRHEFVNFGVSETTEALDAFLRGFREVNPAAQVILTVSPVPLVATMSGHHVLQATTYSKSVLRVAAEQARERYEHVHYFPSYEIVTATGRAHEFFAADRRNVTAPGVERVMEIFFQTFTDEAAAVVAEDAAVAAPDSQKSAAIPVICDDDIMVQRSGVAD
jgi:hypothetical protein